MEKQPRIVVRAGVEGTLKNWHELTTRDLMRLSKRFGSAILFALFVYGNTDDVVKTQTGKTIATHMGDATDAAKKRVQSAVNGFAARVNVSADGVKTYRLAPKDAIGPVPAHTPDVIFSFPNESVVIEVELPKKQMSDTSFAAEKRGETSVKKMPMPSKGNKWDGEKFLRNQNPT